MQNFIEIEEENVFFFSDIRAFNVKDIWFKENLREKYLHSNELKGKKIIFYIFQEMFRDHELMSMVDDLIANFGISVTDIIILDATVYSSHPYRKGNIRTPTEIIELFLNSDNYRFILDDYKTWKTFLLKLDEKNKGAQFGVTFYQERIREKKFFYFNYKTDVALRHLVFSEILKVYDCNIDLLKSDAYLTFKQGVHPEKLQGNVIKNYSGDSIIEIFKKSNVIGKKFNIIPDEENLEPRSEYSINNYEKLFYFMKNCYVGIVCETKFNHEFHINEWRDFDESYTPSQLQLSEKCFIPIAAQNLLYIIEDKQYYRALEDDGFNFSYIKDVFGIDYLNNNFCKNLKETTKVINFLKNSTIQELDSIKKEYSNITFKNALKVIHVLMKKERNQLHEPWIPSVNFEMHSLSNKPFIN